MASAEPALASGIHEDFGRFFSFLAAPQRLALDGRFTRADAPENEASIITLGGRIPYGSFLLVQPEISYVSMITGAKTINSAGDLRVRARMQLWSAGGTRLFFVPGIRAGTGTAELFPYSTASIDIEAGVALVDRHGVFAWWASGSGVYPSRVDDTLKDADLYGNYATASVGGMLSPTERLTLLAGIVAMFPANSPAREIYFLDTELRYSPATTFYVLLQAEAGDPANRAVDFAVGAGVRLVF